MEHRPAPGLGQPDFSGIANRNRDRCILYLGNRTALEEQTKYAVEKRLTRITEGEDVCPEGEDLTEIRIFRYPGSNAFITILNYQSLLAFSKRPEGTPSLPTNPYYYVILDEAHFFAGGAGFGKKAQGRDGAKGEISVGGQESREGVEALD